MDEQNVKSTNIVEIVPVVLEKHPDADSLSIVKVWDYDVVVKTDQWEGINIGAYIPPDNVVPDTEDYKFLDGKRRIKAKKIRGIWSQGLLMPAPKGYNIGDDVTEVMGITHYIPPADNESNSPKFKTGHTETPPQIICPVYDIDTGYKYGNEIEEGEEVIATEKIHGQNYRCVFSSKDNKFYVGSHKYWKKEEEGIHWWDCLKQNMWLKDWCISHPDIVVYAELYGWVQDLRYGAIQGQYFLAVFDLMKNGKFINNDEARQIGSELKWVPIVYRGPYNKEKMKELSIGNSLLLPTQIREGIVVKPVIEKFSRKLCHNRAQVKFVSPKYISRD